jgi:hypothetical protein
VEENRDEPRQTLRSLQDSIRKLETRVAALEAAVGGTVRPPEPVVGLEAAAGGERAETASGGSGLASGLSHTGITLLILGGAFLLRALTDGGVLPYMAGVAAGLVYALFWAALAGRAASRDDRVTAGFRAFASAIIAYPLIWEASTRFDVLSSPASTLVLVIVTAVALGLAFRYRCGFLAAVFTVAASATGLGLQWVTGWVLGLAIVLVGLGVASSWLAYTRGWGGPRWFATLVAHLAVFRVIAPIGSEAAAEAGAVAPLAAEWLALGYLLVYLGSFAVHTLVRRNDVGVFEILQSVLVLAVGLGGAAYVSSAIGAGGAALAAGAIAAGAGSYAVAFLFVDRAAGGGRNFFFYSSLGLVLFLAGLVLLGGTGTATLVWGLLAVAAAAAGGRFDRVTLRAHAAVYAVAAAWHSGLFGVVAAALAGPGAAAWSGAPWAPWALAAAIVAWSLLVVTRSYRKAPRLARVPRTVLASISVLGLSAVLVTVGVLVTGRSAAGEIAVLRTFVISLGAVLFATIHARVRLAELGWLAWAMLAVGAVKLVVQDLRAGGAGTLFLAFALYGIALIVAPRLLRANRGGPAPG